MSKIKKALSLMTRMVLCLLLCALFWNFVINLLTDTRPENKITVYVSVEADALKDREMSFTLEKTKPEGIRMVRCRAFRYLMVDSAEFAKGDIFILPETEAGEYARYFSPLDGEFASLPGVLALDGVPYGVRVWDHIAEEGCAASFIGYGTADADWYLFFGQDSLHNPASESASDGLAAETARAFMNLD